MKAVRIHEHGGPEVLRYEDAEEPRLRPDQVLIKVRACSLNRLDLFVRGGVPGAKLTLPHILGSDAAGEVVEVGELCKRIKSGRRVLLAPGFSCPPVRVLPSRAAITSAAGTVCSDIKPAEPMPNTSLCRKRTLFPFQATSASQKQPLFPSYFLRPGICSAASQRSNPARTCSWSGQVAAWAARRCKSQKCSTAE